MNTKEPVFQRLIAALRAGWLSVVEYTTSQPTRPKMINTDDLFLPHTYFAEIDPADRCECCGRDYKDDESLRRVSQCLASGSQEKAATECGETQGDC